MSIKKGDKIVSHIYKPKLITKNGEEVERVLYLASSGTQFIDTGVKFNRSQPTAEMKFKDLTVKGNLFGTYNGYNAWSNGWGLFNNKTVDNCYYVHYKSNQKFSARTEYAIVRMDRNKVYIDGTLIITQGTIDSYACNNSLYMLSGNFGETRKAEIPTLKIEYFKVWKDDVLVRDFVPVKYGTEYCMLDLVENKLYHNKGTGFFSGGDRVEVKKMSKMIVDNGIKYYLLDCLQSTGTQKIDTNINCNNIGKIETRFSIQNAIGSGGQMLYGYYHSNTASVKRGSNYLQYTQSSMYIYGGGQRNFSPPQRPIINNIYKLQVPIAKAGTGYLFDDDGTQRATVNVTGTLETGKMTLFVIGGNSTVASHYSSAKMYYFKVYDLEDNLISDLIPVEKEDGTKGMLDLVSHTFYENTGTGTFSGNKKEIIMGGD